MGNIIKLSQREHQVLFLIANEMNSHEIAKELFLSHHTIISHRRRIFEKLQVKNIAGMVRKGFEYGILSA
jgi:DNA-binding CsgD family transcriptional regulator